MEDNTTVTNVRGNHQEEIDTMIKKDDDGEMMKEDNPQLDYPYAHQVVEEEHCY